MPILELRDIRKEFGSENQKLCVLDGLNFSISHGEIISIVGQSGSGKTTFLQIAGLLDAPTSGEVFFNQKPCSLMPESDNIEIRRQSMGFIYQFHHLLPEFSAFENLLLPQLIAEVDLAEAKQNSNDVLEMLGLSDRATHLPCALSGGERQRVAIGRAIINAPQLIFADEPTGNLDPHTAEYVFKMLINICRKMNTSMVLVTHNHELADCADKRMELKNGKLSAIV